VASTELWLVEGETFIGRVSLRHTLTAGLLQRGGHIGYYVRPSERHRGYGKAILTLVLQEARQMGIKKVLITCDETNIASKKIIEANGGVLENVAVLRKGNPATLRYWIPLS
jgi:predicted acetyltransferase